ncbi:MAG TPA: efflux RND transporter periplasmic adaptor subunit [Candidatus Binataceae bacterium]|nr:efflux RND transporter periplasmic adaptor subunit [Candidatus Binataceae bacterium]
MIGFKMRSRADLTPRIGKASTSESALRNRVPSLSFVAIASLAAVVLGCKGPARTASAPPPPEVVAAEVIERNVPIYSEYIGTTTGFINADILPEVSSYLLKQDYRNGARVHAGQLLFEINPRPYKAALDQAIGNLTVARAQLKLNQETLARDTALYKKAVISQETFDTQAQDTRESVGQVEADAAAVKSAKLNLQWTKVYSPIDGVAAIATAQVGNLVSTTTQLTTVAQLNPIRVSLSISQQDYLHFASEINAAENGAAKSNGTPLELILGDGSVWEYTGRFYAANLQVSVQTGTIEIQAVFPNPDDILRPGMYVKVRAETGIQRNALLVPQAAVFEIQGEYEVAKVGADDRVALQIVTPGRQVGQLWIIDKGLKPRERVVTEGVQKVKDGMEVRPITAPQAVDVPPATAGSMPTSRELHQQQ